LNVHAAEKTTFRSLEDENQGPIAPEKAIRHTSKKTSSAIGPTNLPTKKTRIISSVLGERCMCISLTGLKSKRKSAINDLSLDGVV
jgi:hypothetical protein